MYYKKIIFFVLLALITHSCSYYGNSNSPVFLKEIPSSSNNFSLIEPVLDLTWSPQGRYLAQITMLGVVDIWDLRENNSLPRFDFKNFIKIIIFSPDERFIASVDITGLIKIWKLDGTLLHTFDNHANTINDLLWSPDGKRLFGLSSDGTIKVWDVTSYKPLFIIEEPLYKNGASNIYDISLSPNSMILATGKLNNTVDLRDSITGKVIHSISNFSDRINTVSFSPNGINLFVCTMDGEITILSTSNWEILWNTQEENTGDCYMDWAPSGNFLITAGLTDRQPKILETKSGKILYTFKNDVYSMAWSPDGDLLALSTTKSVELWTMPIK